MMCINPYKTATVTSLAHWAFGTIDRQIDMSKDVYQPLQTATVISLVHWAFETICKQIIRHIIWPQTIQNKSRGILDRLLCIFVSWVWPLTRVDLDRGTHSRFMFEWMCLCKTAPRSAMGSSWRVVLISLLAYTGKQAGGGGRGFWLQFASANPPTVTITTCQEHARWRALSHSAPEFDQYSVLHPRTNTDLDSLLSSSRGQRAVHGKDGWRDGANQRTEKERKNERDGVLAILPCPLFQIHCIQNSSLEA